jgi:hypothetical protein
MTPRPIARGIMVRGSKSSTNTENEAQVRGFTRRAIGVSSHGTIAAPHVRQVKKVFPTYVHLNTDAIESSPLYRKVLSSPQPGDLVFFP